MIGNILSSARYARILRLLDLERKVILNGPLSGLKPLVERREAAIRDLLSAEHDLPEAFLAALKRRAERNSRLILASLAGVKAASAHLDQIITAGDRLRVYTAEGSQVDVTRAPGTRDTRA